MAVTREASKGSMMKDLIFDAADFILFTNCVLPSTPGYTGLLRMKKSFTMSMSVTSKDQETKYKYVCLFLSF